MFQLLRVFRRAQHVLSVLLSCTAATLGMPVAHGASPFGPNVVVFDPSMPVSQIQAAADAVYAKQASNQFGTDRFALLFKPGTYGSVSDPLLIKVGYYTDVAGLGAFPNDVVINGHVDSFNQCFGANNCIALDNFWRSVSNLTINVTGVSGCYANDFWAVSQGSPMRRVNIPSGQLTLMDYCTGPSYASGGFIADSAMQATIINGSQQQFFTRNSQIGGWSNDVWNQVFSGVVGAPAQGYPSPHYTTLTSTPVSREKPFLTVDGSGSYSVFVPAVQHGSSGPTWSSGGAAGRTIPLSNFLVASPSTPVATINAALASGKSLILTPGVYNLPAAIQVTLPDTTILGLGFPTLVPQTATPAIVTRDVDGTVLAGLIVDAGPARSTFLVQLGTDNNGNQLPIGGVASHLNDPPLVSDVFFRIGGATAGKAITALEVDSADVILDDIWAWRADHGAGVGWNVNKASHGVVIGGDRVTALGLFVEHFQKQQVVWYGNYGQTVFYQSELPYDPPSQAEWTSTLSNGSKSNGYPSYYVAKGVNTHALYGAGVYSFFNQGVEIVEDNAILVATMPGVAVHDAGTVFLNGSGQITHVVNNTGTSVSSSNPDVVSPVVEYP